MDPDIVPEGFDDADIVPEESDDQGTEPDENDVKEIELTDLTIGGAFGSTTGGFGAAKPGGFGAPAASSSSSIFGGGTTTAGTSSGFGGFGGGSNNASSSTPFGGGNTSGGLFGAAKPAFGGTSTTNNNPFGGSSTSTPAFGGGAATGGFGSPASTALGGGPAGECQGTGSVPFQAFIEKEPNSTSNQQNSFQSISFQQPYQKFSPEELRLADYTQGRKFGNSNGQAGAFGTSTGFGGSFGAGNTTGGFGSTPNTNTNTGGGLFGGGSTSSPFGGTSQASTGFGNNTATAGGLFGANKPAGGLFGPTQPAQTGGGLFGSTGTSGGFGAAQPSTSAFGATTNNTGGLFGNNNNTAAKSPFSFGSSQPAAGATGGFGSTATGGAFGSGGGGLFGSTAGQQNTASPFGGAQQQPAAAPSAFGGFGNSGQQQQTGGLFGAANNQPKPAGGLFGAAAAPAAGGLFGGGAQSTPNANPFGGSTNNQNSGGLFGAKPATAGTSLFGNTNNAQTNTGGGGLFGGGFGGQNQNQQQQSTGLFGGLNNNNQQKPGGLFSQPQQQTGGNLFGGSGTQQPNTLFGASNNSQQQPAPANSLFGSSTLFGTPQQQGQQTPQSLTASITDHAAYGGASLFSGLASTQVNNPGPIATPLSSSVRQKKTAALPMYKLNSASTSRFTTPAKRGYGFSYGSYGSPGSASSTSSTPGTFGGSAFGNSLGRTLKTSLSTSSLRRSFGPEDSILAPGAFSASPSTRHFGSTGSVKRLNINRGIRSDLFSPPSNSQQPAAPSILKKKVSFDAHANGNGGSSPLKDIVNGSSPSSEELGLIRPPTSSTEAKKAAPESPPEMTQVRNNELAIVHEEEASSSTPSDPITKPASKEDPTPGEYWTQPSREQIENMSRTQLKAVSNFIVGRHGVGRVEFNQPVDLTGINFDDFFDKVVSLVVRSATVYPDSTKKPPMGKGLNVPSTITLENSWPRNKKGKTPLNEHKKHVDRLKRVGDTKLLSYDKDKGLWVFHVDHFTTYGFPEDDDEVDEEEVSEFGQSTLSAPPDTPTPKTNNMDQSFASTSQLSRTESDPEDTFEFRKKKILPGAFDEQEAFIDDEMEDASGEQYGESFLGERSVGSQSEDGVEEPMDQDDVFQDGESVNIVDQDMAGTYPQFDNTAELDEDSQYGDVEMEAETPGALARARLRAVQKAETPSKQAFAAGNDWTAALQTTISPQKQDRAFLKSLIDIRDNDPQGDVEAPTLTAKRVVSDGRGFATSIDLMNSLFGQNKSPAKVAKVPAKGKGFEVGVPTHI